MQYPHWEYLAALCDDFERIARFVEPNQDNFSAYGVEFVRLLLAAGSEVDVVAKLLCEKVAPGSKLDGINTYRPLMLRGFPNLPETIVTLPRSGLSLTPWREWASSNNPQWWRDYNDVKHERNSAYKSANLGNAVNALAGLMVLTGYLYGEALEDCKLDAPSKLLRFDRKYHSGAAMGDVYRSGYCLPGIPRRTPWADVRHEP